MKTLNLHCPINTTSYGYVSSYFLKGLSENGYDVRHVPISQNSPDPELRSKINDLLNRPFDKNAPSLKIWHQHDLHTVCGRSTSVGFPIFELENFSSPEALSMSYPDFLFVCSDWAKGVASQVRDVDSIFVVPLGYDEEIFKPIRLPETKTTIFANFGKFEKRKGHDILSYAFSKAFSTDDNVALIMMPSNPFLNQDELNSWVNLYRSCPMANRIQFIGRQESQRMVYNIMTQVHCGVFPARAEGWNLEALELLACGRHLIITNCTGHTQFCNEHNSNLINVDDNFEDAHDNKFFFGQGKWRTFGNDQIDQLVEHMRNVHKKHQNGELLLNTAGVLSAEQFTWSKSSQKLASTLDRIIDEQ